MVFQVVSHKKYLKEIEKKGSILVCMPYTGKSLFKDDIKGKCSKCGTAITFRPYNKNADIKLCIKCANKDFPSEV